MRNLRIDKAHEFDKEKGAVISELAGNEDQPWDLEYKALLPKLFGAAHPYGRRRVVPVEFVDASGRPLWHVPVPTGWPYAPVGPGSLNRLFRTPHCRKITCGGI